MHIGVGQAEFKITDSRFNQDVTRFLLEEATGAGVDVLVLPELVNSGYALRDKEEAEAAAEQIPGGPFCSMLAAWSEKNRLVVCGLCEKDSSHLYNTAAVFAEGEYKGIYRKLHLFANEAKVFSAGNIAPLTVDWKGFNFGVMICFDWAFPETARVLALNGAHIILHPANLVLPYCQAAMVTRSLENRVFTATANRTGEERGLAFSGMSQVTSPKGEVLVQASRDFCGVIVSEVDLVLAEDKMITAHNHVFKDRRPEFYKRILES
jgi:beta-ureidopropionase